MPLAIPTLFEVSPIYLSFTLKEVSVSLCEEIPIWKSPAPGLNSAYHFPVSAPNDEKQG